METTKHTLSVEFMSLWANEPEIESNWKAINIQYDSISTIVSSLSSLPDLDFSEFSKLTDPGVLEIGAQVKVFKHAWKSILLRNYLKIFDFTKIFILSCNNKNIFGCVLSLRAILEHTAFLQYLLSIIPLQDKSELTDEKWDAFKKEFIVLTTGSTFSWDDYFQPGGIKKMLECGILKRPHNAQLPPLTTFIKSLDESHANNNGSTGKEYQMLYAILCDIVHPSCAGDLMIKEPNMDCNENYKACIGPLCPKFANLLEISCHLYEKLIKLSKLNI